MDRILIAAADVVEAWDDHTLELEAAIRTLAKALEARTAPARQPCARERVAAGVATEASATR